MISRFAHLSIKHWEDRFSLGELLSKFLTSLGTLLLLDRIHIGLGMELPVSMQLYLVLALLMTAIWVRPRVRYQEKLSDKDTQVSIAIRNAFDIQAAASSDAALVVPCNTTFETDLEGRIPRAPSIQGEFTRRYYGGNPNELYKDITRELARPKYEEWRERRTGYNDRTSYAIGTVVQIRKRGLLFYLLASSRINEHGRSETTQQDLNLALKKLWNDIGHSGDKGEIVIPLIGTEHGRVSTDRQSAAKSIISSFIGSTTDKTFCSRLTVAIFPPDVNKYQMNLDELAKYLKCVTRFPQS